MMTQIHHDTEPTSSSDLRVAFLGPPGTYTHQAALEVFGKDVEYISRSTITDVFGAVNAITPVAVVPQENSIFGAVIETYDSLRKRSVGHDIFVVGEIILAIQHCLLVRKGVSISDIGTVLSHEQALGQCRIFLASNLPNAALIKMPSTAAAAQILLHSSHDASGPDPLRSAAICSKMQAETHDCLQVLKEGIQDEKSNFTRFYLLSSSLSLPKSLANCVDKQRHALIRISLSSERCTPDITACLFALNLATRRLDRRPSAYEEGFHDVYIVEVQARPDISSDWGIQVDTGLQRVRQLGVTADLIGLW